MATMARLLLLLTCSVTFPAKGVGVAVTFPIPGPMVTFPGPGVTVTLTTGGGVIVTTDVGSTAGAVAVGTRVTVGPAFGDAEGVGHGAGVALGKGVGDDVGDGMEVGTGVAVTVGLGGRLMSVGTGRGVVMGQPDGSSAMLCMVSWLRLAPRLMPAVGRMYRTMPIKQMMAIKLNSALSNGLPLQDGPLPDQLLL